MLLSRQADIVLAYRLPGEDHPIATDYIETAVIGTDRLIPVVATDCLAATLAQIGKWQLTYIAYPGDVFFGQVMNRIVLSGLTETLHLIARAETALTLAAIEMAVAGAAVAWVPASLAAERIGEGKLADLSHHLPSCPLEMTAVRLLRGFGVVGKKVWDSISTFKPAPG